jgi:hypothetical protein
MKGLVLELREVEYASLNKMLNIDLNLNKDIKHFPPSLSNGHKTRMSIMNQQITLHQIRSYIIDTTCTIGNVAHDNCVNLYLINLVTERF